MSNKIEIINSALSKLGVEPIVSLEEGTTNSKVMKRIYDATLKAALRSHPWLFAWKQINIAASSTAPLFGYDYQYELPADFVRLVRDDRSRNIRGNYIFTNEEAPLEVDYISYITDTEKFDPLFTQAFSSMLAMEAASALGVGKDKLDSVLGMYNLYITQAKRCNAMDRGKRKPTGVSPWEEARYV